MNFNQDQEVCIIVKFYIFSISSKIKQIFEMKKIWKILDFKSIINRRRYNHFLICVIGKKFFQKKKRNDYTASDRQFKRHIHIQFVPINIAICTILVYTEDGLQIEKWNIEFYYTSPFKYTLCIKNFLFVEAM